MSTNESRPGANGAAPNTINGYDHSTPSPWMRAAELYWKAGVNPLPIRNGTAAFSKGSPPSGYTGGKGQPLGYGTLQRWTTAEYQEPYVNVCIRSLGGWIGIDVDAHDGKLGDEMLRKLEAEYGPLPETWSSTSRGILSSSRIYFFRVPVGTTADMRDPGEGIEVIRPEHRYALVWPSVHPDTGREYCWYTPSGEIGDRLPGIRDFAMLPEEWIDGLGAQRKAEATPNATTTTEGFDAPARVFTEEQARGFCRPAIEALKKAQNGEINNRLNDAAVMLSHFVPEFWSVEQATKWLMKALESTVYDGKTWRAEDTIRSGLSAPTWKAERVEPEAFDMTDESPDRFEALIQDAYLRELAREKARERIAEEKATASASAEAIEKLTAELLSSADLDDIPDLEPLVEGWLYRDTMARIVGASGSFKTFVALDIACAVATRKPWFGYGVNGGPAVYVVAEGARGIRKRVRAWEVERNDGRRVDGLFFLPRPIQMLGPEWLAFVGACKKAGAALIVLDTQARVTVGANENDNTEMGQMVDMGEKLRRETGACVVLVHHTGHSEKDRARGASAIYAAMQTELNVSRKAGERNLTISASKQKDGPEETVELKMVDAVESLVLANLDGSDAEVRESTNEAVGSSFDQMLLAAENNREAVARVLHFIDAGSGGGVTKSEAKRHVAETCKKAGRTPPSEATVYRVLNEMRRDEWVEDGRTSDRMRLSATGCAALGLPYSQDGDAE